MKLEIQFKNKEPLHRQLMDALKLPSDLEGRQYLWKLLRTNQLWLQIGFTTGLQVGGQLQHHLKLQLSGGER